MTIECNPYHLLDEIVIFEVDATLQTVIQTLYL